MQDEQYARQTWEIVDKKGANKFVPGVVRALRVSKHCQIDPIRQRQGFTEFCWALLDFDPAVEEARMALELSVHRGQQMPPSTFTQKEIRDAMCVVKKSGLGMFGSEGHWIQRDNHRFWPCDQNDVKIAEGTDSNGRQCWEVEAVGESLWHVRLDFLPSPYEARVALSLAEQSVDDDPVTREQVHAAITPGVECPCSHCETVRTAACPGCSEPKPCRRGCEVGSWPADVLDRTDGIEFGSIRIVRSEEDGSKWTILRRGGMSTTVITRTDFLPSYGEAKFIADFAAKGGSSFCKVLTKKDFATAMKVHDNGLRGGDRVRNVHDGSVGIVAIDGYVRYCDGRKSVLPAHTRYLAIVSESHAAGKPSAPPPAVLVHAQDGLGNHLLTCVECEGPIESYGPPAEGLVPDRCGECCTCGNMAEDEPHRCRACGSWDMDRHGDTPPATLIDPPDRRPDAATDVPECAHQTGRNELYCPMCERQRRHEIVFELLPDGLPPPTRWRCTTCTAVNYIESPELHGLREPVSRKPFWPRDGGNEIGMPLLRPWRADVPVHEAQRVLPTPCDGEHVLPRCGHPECWHGPMPKAGDLVVYEQTSEVEGPKTITETREGIVVPRGRAKELPPPGYIFVRQRGEKPDDQLAMIHSNVARVRKFMEEI